LNVFWMPADEFNIQIAFPAPNPDK